MLNCSRCWDSARYCRCSREELAKDKERKLKQAKALLKESDKALKHLDKIILKRKH